MINININKSYAFCKEGTKIKTSVFPVKENLHSLLYKKIMNPTIVTDKNLAYLWNFSQCEQKFEILTELNQTDLNLQLAYTRVLLLDYDNLETDIQETLESIQNRFAAYKFYIYTSFSHTTEKNKFRVILPMSEKLSKEDGLILFSGDSKGLRESIFGGCDPRSFLLSQTFYVPSTADVKNYYAAYNDEKNLFSFTNEQKIAIEEVKLIKADIKREMNSKVQNTPTVKNPEKYLAAGLKKLSNEISSFDINFRGQGRGTHNKIAVFYAQLYRLYEKCGDSNPDASAKDYLCDFAKGDKAKKAINNIKSLNKK